MRAVTVSSSTHRYRLLFFRQKCRLIYDFAIVEWYLSRIHQLLYGLKPLYDNMSCIILII